MRKLLASALLFLALAIPAVAQQSVFVPATTSSIGFSISTATTTKLITGASGKSIYVTAIAVSNAGGSGSLKFVTGTGTNCGTGQADLSGAFSFTASGAGLNIGTGNGAVLVVPAAQDLCVTTNSAVVIPGFLSFSIF